MSVEVDRDAMLAVLRQVVEVVESRNTIPVLGNLVVEARGGTMTITGTDLNIQATATVQATGEMLTTISKDKLVAAVSSFRAGKMTLKQEDGKGAVVLRQGRGQRTLQTLSAEHFPRMPALENAARFSMPVERFRRLFDATHVAMANDPTRPYLEGVYLHLFNGGALRAAACDGHRAIRVEADVPAGAEEMPGVIIPRKAVTLLRRLMVKREGAVSIAVTAKAVDIEVDGVRVVAKVIDGTYPDYERTIPSSGEHNLVLAPACLIEPVSAVAAVVNGEGDKKIRAVHFVLDGETREVRTKDSHGTFAIEPLDAEVEGGAFEFAVNHQYLTGIIASFSEAGKVTVSMRDAASPMRVTGDHDPDLVAVIMPMRI